MGSRWSWIERGHQVALIYHLGLDRLLIPSIDTDNNIMCHLVSWLRDVSHQVEEVAPYKNRVRKGEKGKKLHPRLPRFVPVLTSETESRPPESACDGV
jgi:hypothetical protein